MAPFWVANLVIWLVVMAVAAPGAWSAAFGRKDAVRRGDPMRLATFLVAALFSGHTLRWLWRPDDGDFWRALYVVGVLTGGYVLRLMVAYGRGHHV